MGSASSTRSPQSQSSEKKDEILKINISKVSKPKPRSFINRLSAGKKTNSPDLNSACSLKKIQQQQIKNDYFFSSTMKSDQVLMNSLPLQRVKSSKVLIQKGGQDMQLQPRRISSQINKELTIYSHETAGNPSQTLIVLNQNKDPKCIQHSQDGSKRELSFWGLNQKILGSSTRNIIKLKEKNNEESSDESSEYLSSNISEDEVKESSQERKRIIYSKISQKNTTKRISFENSVLKSKISNSISENNKNKLSAQKNILAHQSLNQNSFVRVKEDEKEESNQSYEENNLNEFVELKKTNLSEKSFRSQGNEQLLFDECRGSEKHSQFQEPQIKNFMETYEHIRKEDVDANDSFDCLFPSLQELEEQSESIDMIQNAENKKVNTDPSTTQRQKVILETSLSLFSSSPFNSYNLIQKFKQKKSTYLRTQHTHFIQKFGEEKYFKIEVFYQNRDEQTKVCLANKEDLYSQGICAHSRKGISQESEYNMSDYFVYTDPQQKAISIFMGHGIFGHIVSNLACRLLFKHFLKSPLIRSDPENGLYQLFKQVDKFISQHIIYYDLENSFNCLLSGVSCSLVLLQNNKLYVASVGNIQAVVFKKNTQIKVTKANYIQLSGFHLPTNKEERQRIHKNTGEIRKWKNEFVDRIFVRGRTFPGIEVTRCFGSEIGKMIGIISDPEIVTYEISKSNDLFLIIATPNFFEHISYEETSFLLNQFSKKTVKKATEILLRRVKSIQLSLQGYETIGDITFSIYYFN